MSQYGWLGVLKSHIEMQKQQMMKQIGGNWVS